MPVYNVEKYVRRALISALDQTYDNLEILVIDDKGSDNSMDIVREIQATHPRGEIIRIIEHSVNKGLGATRNTAIDNAKGELIMFMDSDDYITCDCVELLYNSMIENKTDMVIGSYDEFKNYNDIIKTLVQNMILLRGNDALYEWYKSPLFYVQTWNKLYKIQILKDSSVRCIPSNRNEDVFFTFQLLKVVKSVSFVDKVTYHYQTMDPTSITYDSRIGVFNFTEHKQYIEILNEMIKYMIKNGYAQDSFLNEYFLWIYRIRIGYIVKAKTLSNKQKSHLLNDLHSIEVKNIDFPKPLRGIIKYGKSWLYTLLSPKVAITMSSLYQNIRNQNIRNRK